MNSIASFRLCTLTDSELLKKVDSLTDRMYPDRQIPARPNDDFDILVAELVIRYAECIEECERLVKVAEHWQNEYNKQNTGLWNLRPKIDNL